MAGLSGGNDNLYLYSMIKTAQLSGYKCVVINFRGTSGTILTSPTIYWISTWKDLKEPFEYIHQKYCGAGGQDLQYLKRNIYAYSVSLGAGMLARYVISSGDQCVLSGVLVYGLFINIMDNVSYFKNTGMKFYDKAIGFNYYLILKGHEKEMRLHLGEEQA